MADAAPSADDSDGDTEQRVADLREAQTSSSDSDFRKHWKAILISCAASMFEFYDFGILGFFSYELAQSLLPPQFDEIEDSMWVYALFWCGFIARPFGGALFGYIADYHGRKLAFRFSVICMALCTFAIGCIPKYETIGIAAPIILLLLRLTQGLSSGGEIASALVYIFEIAPANKRAFWQSIVVMCSFGTFLATLSKVLISAIFSDETIFSWAWRIPFWCGILLIFIGFWSKSALKPSPAFQRIVVVQNEEETELSLPKNPFVLAFCHDRYHLLASITFVLASGFNHILPFLFNVYLPDYLDSEAMHGWRDENAYQFNACTMCVSMLTMVIVGYFVDKYGALRFMMASSVTTFFAAPLVWYLFTITTSEWQDFMLMISVATIPYITTGAVVFWYNDVLLPDPRTRTQVFGISYNIGAVLWAGTVPFLATCFIQIGGAQIGSILTGCWVSLLALISSIAYLYGEYAVKREYAKYNEQHNIASMLVDERQQLTANKSD